MPETRYLLTAHARTVIAARGIEPQWIERALARPQRTEPDPADAALTHALLPIDERDRRVLRVVYNGSTDPLRVVTAYFDRRLRGKP